MRVLLALLLLSSVVTAHDVIKSGNVTLLALTESGEVQVGTIAQLGLEIRPGSERVYLETFPMTKVTTQASLRFAQQVACSELEVDCSQYDFLFTIKALPGIVGGPSAGGAATVLITSLLLDKPIPQAIAMTGTINSGGMIGPVGGLQKKIEAAGSNHIKTVLIPKGTRQFEEDNKTIDLVEFGRGLNLSVNEVATIHEVLEIALGIKQPKMNESLKIDERYLSIMKAVANDLCERSRQLNGSDPNNFTMRASAALANESYYSAASFCFRANVDARSEWYANLSKEEALKRAHDIGEDISAFRNEVLTRNISSLTDVQTFMAVMERVEEAQGLLNESVKELENNNSAQGTIGFAQERLFSAKTWARFFDGANGFAVNKEELKESCMQKIAEAEERYSYVKSIIPDALDGTREDIDKAYSQLSKGDIVMCLYGAAKAKAETEVLLNLLGVSEERFGDVIDLKLNISRDALMKAQKKGVFPIIAYSYYDYAQSLRGFDNVSALLFSEYALELSNLDVYFEKEYPKAQVEPPITIVTGLIVLLVVLALFSFYKPLQAPRRLRGKKR